MAFGNNNPSRVSMERVDKDERLVATVYRHLFGIVSLYIQVIFGLVAASALIFFILPEFISREEYPEVYNWIGLGLLVVVVLLALILFVATVIYHESRLVITDRTITEVAQEGLFNRKISQLTLGNIEDVTANRRGLVQTMLNFGTLNIQTAGETENFYFLFCPEPDHFAKMILELRERFLELHGGAEEARHFAPRGNSPPMGPYYGQPQAAYAQPMPPQYYQQPAPPPSGNQYTTPYPPQAPVPSQNSPQYSAPLPRSTPETDYHEPV